MWKSLYRFLSSRRPAGLSRLAHVWSSAGPALSLPPDKEVSRLAVGVVCLAAYAPLSSDRVWLHSFHRHTPPPSHSWHQLQLHDGNHGDAGTVKQVAAGQSHLIALSCNGEVFGFGANSFGQCGPAASGHSTVLTKIPSEHKFTQVACGLDHSLFVTVEGRVLSCGWGADGQTGTGEARPREILAAVSLPTTISSVSSCADTSFALTELGEVFSWGNNEYGQLAVATAEQQVFSPVQVDCSHLDGRVVSIATGGCFTAVLTSKGSVYYAGYGLEEGDQSDGTTTELLPSEWSHFRQLCDGVRVGRVVRVQAGLNYLAVWSEAGATIWGRYPGNTKLTPRTLPQHCTPWGTACGHDLIAAIVT